MDEIIKLLKQDIADCRVNDGNCVDNADDVNYALATLETLIEAINNTRCCKIDSEQLKIPKTTKEQRVQLNEGYNKK